MSGDICAVGATKFPQQIKPTVGNYIGVGKAVAFNVTNLNQILTIISRCKFYTIFKITSTF